MALHSVGLNPSSLARFDDGDPRIRLGCWFVSKGGLNAGWSCVGARVYLPAGTPAGLTLRAYLILWADPVNLPAPSSINLAGFVRSGDIVTDGVVGWHDVTWAPQPFADTPNNLLFVYYEFLGAGAGDYLYTGAGNDPLNAIQSPDLPGLYAVGPGDINAPARSWFAQVPADSTSANAATSGFPVWYGIDVLVNDNATPAVPTGAAGITYSYDIQAGGEAPPVDVPEGGANIAYAFNVGAVGETPVLDVPNGSATLSYRYDVTARGVTPGDDLPVQEDTLILPLLQDLLACLCLQLETSPGGPTCFCGLVPAQQVAMDFCTCTDSGDSCGMAWVRLAGSYPSTQFPVPQNGPQSCTAPTAARVELGVTRCVPGMDEQGNPPDVDQQQQAVRVQLGDMAAIRRALDCCFTRPRKEWVLGQYTPVGPLGNCAGGAYTVTVRLM